MDGWSRRYPEALPPGVVPRETVDDALSAFTWGMYQIAVPLGTVSMTAMRDPLTLFRSIEHTAAEIDSEEGDEQEAGHEAVKQKWCVKIKINFLSAEAPPAHATHTTLST
jgi:hypothetical protein